MTVEEWVHKCRSELEDHDIWFGHGTDNALDEALWLVLAAIDQPADGSFTQWKAEIDSDGGIAIRKLLENRIKSRKPLAYLIGEAWFCGHKFYVDENVLVPRSPIAELVINRFSPWVDSDRLENVLDLCTGSGCIGIAIALQIPGPEVDIVDISNKALQLATRNVELHGLSGKMKVLKSDLFASLGSRRYDLIVSNPPYVSEDEFRALPNEYHAEPEIALVTGFGGLEIPMKILCQSADFLEPDGVLICEVGENAAALQSVLPGLPLTWLEFEHGGSGVFVVTKAILLEHRVQIETALEKLKDVA